MMGSFLYFCQTPTELIVNGGFEQSKSLYPWVVETTKGGVLISGPNENGNPHGGNRYVTLGGTNNETDAIEQTTIIPQNIANLTLSFALRIKSTGNDKTAHDFLKVMVKGEALDDVLMQYSNTDASDWQIINIPNLTTYSGKLVTLRFEAETDGTKPTKFMIDDVSLIYIAGQGTPTPNLEFISPHFGCVYPISTITGATPLTVLTDAPNGIESLTVSIDDKVITTTTDKRLELPINWSNLTPGEHTLTAELIDPIGERKLRRCTITSSNLLEGGDFENSGSSRWVGATPDKSTRLIKNVGSELAYSGFGCALFPNIVRGTQTLDEMVSIPCDAQDTLTLSFLYKADLGGRVNQPSTLSLHLIDVETLQDFLVGTIIPSEGDWILTRIPISMSGKGLLAGKDYYLTFKVEPYALTSYTTFYLDDVSLYVYSNTLSAGAPLPDEDGDIPYEETATKWLEINVHRDLPNKCNCNHSTHQNITIDLAHSNITNLPPPGCNISTDILKVKFYQESHVKGVFAENVCLTQDGKITCTIPDAKDPNDLERGRIKVKVHYNGETRKAETRQYDGSDSEQDGFFWGFPEKPMNFQLLSNSTPSVLGFKTVNGQNQVEPFSMTSTNLFPFKQRLSDGTCPSTDGFVIKPRIYAMTAPGHIGVEISTYTQVSPNNCWNLKWDGYWKGDGSPTICGVPYECVSTTQFASLRGQNPDNFAKDGSRYNPKFGNYEGKLDNVLHFLPPQTPPSFTSNSNYGPANSVGYDIYAVCPKNGASNHIVFTGSNVFRIKNDGVSNYGETGKVYKNLSGAEWSPCNPPCPRPPCSNDPCVQIGPWGTGFDAWLSQHRPGNVVPKITTEDGYTVILNNISPLTIYPSFSADLDNRCIMDMANNNCQQVPNDNNCSTFPPANLVTPANWQIDNFTVGPGEKKPTATVLGCRDLSGHNSCSKISLFPFVDMTQSNVNNQGVNVNSLITFKGSTMDEGAAFNISIDSDYGHIITRGVTLWFLAPPSGNLIVTVDASPTSGPPPLTVNFTAWVTGGNGTYNYSWNFGDGAINNENKSSISHTYTSEGTYTAVVTVTDGAGQTGSASVIIIVSNIGGSLSASPVSGVAPLTVNYTCNPTGGSGYYTQYEWNFGDGQTQITNINTVSHTYNGAGYYTAEVKATDSNGLQSPAIKGPEISVKLPVSVYANPTSGKAPLAVTFTAATSGGTSPYTFNWNFGDGQTGTGDYVSHTYSTTGSYTAKVTVTDSATPKPNTGEKSTSISVAETSPNFYVTLDASPNSGLAPLNVQFTATPYYGTSPYIFYWNFGDGATQTTSSSVATHAYQSSGTYTASVTANDSQNQSSSAICSINVYLSGQFKISGKIFFSTGPSLPVDIDLTGPVNSATQSNRETGYYEFTGLPNGTYRVKPRQNQLFFIYPTETDVVINGADVTDINFDYEPISIEGVVTGNDSLGVGDVKLEVGTKNASTDNSGNYYFTNLAPGNYTIEPSAEDKMKYDFDPPSRNVTIQNDNKPVKDQNFKVKKK